MPFLNRQTDFLSHLPSALVLGITSIPPPRFPPSH
jgi:hypothetical protein